MKLAMKTRVSEKKKDVKEIRREGNIPAILYSPQKTPEKLTIVGEEFRTVLREMLPGRRSTTVFTLSDGKTERKAIVKDIQYICTTYEVSHLDFEELVKNVPVRVKVPVTCTGLMDCMGIKLGGFLRHVSRFVKVLCLPEHIPAEFSLDVKDLGIRQSKRIKDLAMPAGVKPLSGLEEVVVVIAKK